MSSITRGRVRAPFRWIGAIVGTFICLAGIRVVGLAVLASINSRRHPHWEWLAIGLGGAALGIRFWQAAVTGRDSYVETEER